MLALISIFAAAFRPRLWTCPDKPRQPGRGMLVVRDLSGFSTTPTITITVTVVCTKAHQHSRHRISEFSVFTATATVIGSFGRIQNSSSKLSTAAGPSAAVVRSFGCDFHFRELGNFERDNDNGSLGGRALTAIFQTGRCRTVSSIGFRTRLKREKDDGENDG